MDRTDPSPQGPPTEPGAAPEPGLASLDFAALYREHFVHVWHALRRVGVPASELEDAAHDVFVVVHRRLGDFEHGRPMRPWLSGIAVRVASDRRRKAYRRRETSAGEAEWPATEASSSPERDLQRSRDRRTVADALEELPAEQRAVFVMHELDGFSMPEIAEALQTPLNTCYSRLRLARRRFTDAVRRQRGRRGAR